MAEFERLERFQQVVRPLIAQTARPPAHVDVDIVDRRRTGRPETIAQHKTSPDRRSGDEPGFDYGLWIIRRKRGEILGQCLDPLSLRCVDQGTCSAWQGRATAPRCDQADHHKKAGASHRAASIRNRSTGVESVITTEPRRRKRKASIPSASLSQRNTPRVPRHLPPPATPNSSSARDHTIDAGAPAACAAPRAPGSSPSGPQASCLRYPVTPARRPSPHLPRPPSPWRRLPCLRSPPQQHRRPPAFCRSAGRRHTMLRRSRPEPRRAWSLRWNNTGAPPLAGTPAACIFQHTPPPS